ncbi:hypothetical protein CAI21_12130 [Alkalilimnicola ehrlichii]|uniref:Sulfatase-modifying factor enzyme-like domain-containing protein n=1 Tax=Alkalilimnicola ehrlichii TaxID=351052 RepID=A0A3E0WUA2_9GAMM|nr:formylglycine-generating enzyme family protein [Alkalilimnicola ehrlichii]RFA28599.1 hypothetical protein CAI21_12130 [Alkalilimnicola ehrlichii]RFA35763.1 hypothetical protein CAL65_12650 [Alkalilimnicola ehrlichii]
MRHSIFFAALLIASGPVPAEPVRIDGGYFQQPILLDENTRETYIDAFYLDARQVSNAEFLAFVRQEPAWQRDRIPRLFAQPNYLKHWPQALTLGQRSAADDRPVTYVSWYAARAYCAAQGGRLPSLDEWEYAAALQRNASNQSGSEYAHALFAWYTNPKSRDLAPVAATEPGPLGLHDMHGLVLEWVEDFQLLLTQGDKTDLLGGSCGDTARFMPKFDEEHYATFFRYQSRSNFNARSTTSTLGFRCAYNVEEPL